MGFLGGRLARGGVFVAKGIIVSKDIQKRRAERAGFAPVRGAAVDEAVENAYLNAIADERQNGPFVAVSLDDL